MYSSRVMSWISSRSCRFVASETVNEEAKRAGTAGPLLKKILFPGLIIPRTEVTLVYLLS